MNLSEFMDRANAILAKTGNTTGIPPMDVREEVQALIQEVSDQLVRGDSDDESDALYELLYELTSSQVRLDPAR